MLYSLSRALIILFFSFFLVIGAIRIFPLFPYTTLFRSVGILENRALGVVEIVPRSGRFDYESKYTAGMTEYHWPAKLTDQQTAEIRQMAEIAFRACGCRDFARADFMMSDRGEIFFLEINTLPGLTETRDRKSVV